jgi:ABC-type dipeptide/oligopeptide/nickel transport system permease subunit
MLNTSRDYLRNDPWMAISPGVVLALLLLGLGYLAERCEKRSTRDASTPASRILAQL